MAKRSKTGLQIHQRYKLSDNHVDFVKCILNEDVRLIFADGPAGTSKTYCSVYAALRLLERKHYNNIVYVRSLAESGSKTFGILPGEAEDKFKPWAIPLIEKLDELIPVHMSKKMFADETIKCTPVNYLRGSTFRESVVIIDEAQNLNLNELITTLTRIGENCKIVVLGDTMQSDISDKLSYYNIFNCFGDEESCGKGVWSYKFTEEDITRSEILKFIIVKLSALKEDLGKS
tara:strand:- start:36 stop:731 length:696 start_codon:yes stop_codon:yes gene_type:complete